MERTLNLQQLPCERGDEHDTPEAKGDKVCKGGYVNVLNNTQYTLGVWARTLHPGATLEARQGAPGNGQGNSSTLVGKPVVLGTAWTRLTAVLPAGAYSSNPAPAAARTLFLKLRGVAPGERAAVIWLDTVSVAINSTSV